MEFESELLFGRLTPNELASSVLPGVGDLSSVSYFDTELARPMIVLDWYSSLEVDSELILLDVDFERSSLIQFARGG